MDRTTLADRALIRLSGGGVREWLNGLVTQDVAGPLPVWAGLLTAQGKCLFDFIVWDGGEGALLLDCAAAEAEALGRRLALYRLRRAIVIEPVAGLAVHWAPAGAEVLGVVDPRLAALGRRWLAVPGEATTGWPEHRLRLGVCEGEAELGGLLWLECNAAELNGASFSKGCYVGQENTARMNWRGKVNRRLVVVAGDGGERVRTAYPELGLAVVHARVEDLPAGAIVPDWLAAVLA